MKERPILFSGPMVRAIRDGRKTQTRRVIKPQPTPWKANDAFWLWRGSDPLTDSMLVERSPYGRVGDRLWVRETWDAPPGSELIQEVAYRADYKRDPVGARWRPAIHMPRWASRITLELTEVRVERLQAITEDDARAEGVTPFPADPEGDCWTDGKHRTAFEYAWGTINGFSGEARAAGKSWSDNPWCWCLTFRRVL